MQIKNSAKRYGFGHWGLGIRHQLIYRDRCLQRMLPFTHQQ